MKDIKSVENELRKLSLEEYPQAIIRSGAWSNPSIVMAYTSFFRTGNPAEESTDFVVQLTVSEDSVEFRVDIAYSNGEMIADLLYEVIKFQTKDELLIKANEYSKKASELLINKLRELYINGFLAK
ncbi:MAG TPA: hypothetical protein VJ436_14420 [Anaerolineales bacterium]|nr:hypothetical protein [Anaerolineales bacterium]